MLYIFSRTCFVFLKSMAKARSAVSGTEKSICFCTSEMPVHNSLSVSLITVIIFVCAGHGPPRPIMGEKEKHGD